MRTNYRTDTINTIADGLLVMFETAIDIVDWDAISDKIKKFFEDIDWKVKLAGVGTALAAGLAFIFGTMVIPSLTYLCKRGIGKLFTKVLPKC